MPVFTAWNDGLQVLVHCQAGVSRSAAVVLAYMCASMGLSAEESLEVLKITSPQACPNVGFMRQVHLFETMGCELPAAAHDDYHNSSMTRINSFLPVPAVRKRHP